MQYKAVGFMFVLSQSTVEVGFWAELGRLKLDTLRLSEDTQPITGEPDE